MKIKKPFPAVPDAIKSSLFPRIVLAVVSVEYLKLKVIARLIRRSLPSLKKSNIIASSLDYFFIFDLCFLLIAS